MKTRENELHTPDVGIQTSTYFIKISVKCAICGNEINSTTEWFGDSAKQSKAFLDNKIPNYCPNCGARLKEVK